MLGTVSIAGIEGDLHSDAIADCGAGCLSNITMQVQIKASVAYRHQIDAPRIRWFAIDSQQDRQGLTPARLDGVCAGSSHKNIGVDVSNLDDRDETRGCHGNVDGSMLEPDPRQTSLSWQPINSETGLAPGRLTFEEPSRCSKRTRFHPQTAPRVPLP